MGKQENKKTVELSIAKCIEVKYTTSSVLKEKSITENINYKTEWKADNLEGDSIKLSLRFHYIYKGEDVFFYECAFIYNIKNKAEIILFSDTDIKDRVDILPILISISYSTMRGMIAIRLKDTVLQDMPIPIINPEEAFKKVDKD